MAEKEEALEEALVDNCSRRKKKGCLFPPLPVAQTATKAAFHVPKDVGNVIFSGTQ